MKDQKDQHWVSIDNKAFKPCLQNKLHTEYEHSNHKIPNFQDDPEKSLQFQTGGERNPRSTDQDES